MSINPEFDMQKSKLHREVSHLRKQNKQLNYIHSKYMEDINENEHFFIKVANEIKKNIVGRKPMKYCSFDDFRK